MSRRENESSAIALPTPGKAPSAPRPEDQVPAVWHIGDVILGLYEVKDVYWPGAIGLVYRVRHREWDVDLAVKSPRETPFETEKQLQKFVEAADEWVGLGLFPHIVSCYYVRKLGGIPRLFLEFVDGGSLHDWIHTRRLYEGGSGESLKRILDIAIQFAWGLQHAHQHDVIHQDVKPGNLLLTADGVAKLKGLASARGALERSANRDNNSPATAFSAPEQVGTEKLSRQANIWSWAASVLEMFTGELLWREGAFSDAVLETYLKKGAQGGDIPQMPAAVVELLAQCLQKDPASRPESMAEVAGSLRKIYKKETGSDHARRLPIQASQSAGDLNNRALSLFDLGRTDEALWLWDEALNLSPQHVEATYNSGLVRWRIGRITDNDLVSTLEGLKHSGARHGFINYLLSRVHLERDDTKASGEALENSEGSYAETSDVSEALTLRNKGLQSERPLTAFFDDEICGPNLFTPGGKSLLLTVSGFKVRILDFDAPLSPRYLQGHAQSITAIAISADGRYALTSSEDATIRLWDLLTAKCVRTITDEGWTQPNLLALSADGAQAVLRLDRWSEKATLQLWDLRTSRRIRDFETTVSEYGEPQSISAVAISPDGKYVLSGGDYGTVQLWNVADGKLVRDLKGLWGSVGFVQFSPDGGRCIAAGDREVREFDVYSGTCLEVLTVDRREDDRKTSNVTVSADGNLALFGSSYGELKLWEVNTGKCVRTFQDLTDRDYEVQRYQGIESVNLSPDGKYSLSGTRGGTYKLWRFNPEYHAPLIFSRITATEEAIDNQFAAEENLANARQAMAENRFVDAASYVRTARLVAGYERSREAVELWTSLYVHLPRTHLKASWHSHEVTAPELPGSIGISGDGKYVLFGSFPMEVKEVETEYRSQPFETAVSGKVALSWDGRLAMAGGYDGFALWDTGSGKKIDDLLRSHEKHVDDLQFSADGTHAISCSEHEVRVWTIGADGLRCRHWIEADWGQQSAVAISSDNKYCIAGVGFSSFRDNDYRLRLWDVDTGECRIIDGYDSGIYALTFTPDNKHFLGGGFDGKLRLWDVATGECVRLFEGHTIAVDSVDISADGRFAISGGRDHTMRLWDMATGECLRIWEIKTNFIGPIRFSADCKHLLAGTREHTVRVELLDWELDNCEPADWDEGAKPFLETFLMRRAGKSSRKIPAWSGDEFEGLMRDLGCAGYGWLRPEGVRRELEKQAAEMAPEYSASRVRFNEVADAGYSLLHDERPSPFWITNPALEAASIEATSWTKLYDETPQTSVRAVVAHNWILVSPDWPDRESLDMTFDQPVAFSRNHELVASCFDRTLRLWDSRKGYKVQDYAGFVERLECVSFSDDGGFLAMGAARESIMVWDLSARKWIAAFSIDKSRHEAICFKQNGKLLASGAWDGTVKVWSVKTSKVLRLFTGHEDRISTLDFSRAGNLLASGSWDRTVKLWDLETGACVRTLPEHNTSVGIVRFSPDGKLLATSSRDKYGNQDKTVFLWDVESGGCIRSFHGHEAGILSFEFNAAGPYLVSAAEDGSVRLWDVRTAECLYVMDATLGDAAKSSARFAHRVGFAQDGQNILYCRGQRDWVERAAWTVDWEYEE